MKHENLKAVLLNAKAKSPKRATTQKTFNFKLKGFGAGGGQVYVKGQTVLHVWSYNGFSGSFDAKWNAETKQWFYDGYKENDAASVERFMNLVKETCNQELNTSKI